MKTCSVTGCNNPVWGKGMCQKHIPKKPLKKTAFKSCPIPEPKTGMEKIMEDAVTELLENRVVNPKTQKRNEFFMSIWNKRLRVCGNCNKFLGAQPRSYMFDHLLEKYKYPDLEFEEDNIMLVCLECHDEKTRGIISEKYQEKINFVITKFNVS